jgi:hypothetical protein
VLSQCQRDEKVSVPKTPSLATAALKHGLRQFFARRAAGR